MNAQRMLDSLDRVGATIRDLREKGVFIRYDAVDDMFSVGVSDHGFGFPKYFGHRRTVAAAYAEACANRDDASREAA